MISDITLGQYFPAKSPMHRTDPRMKICLTVFAIVLIFVARNFLSLAVSVLFIGVGMACSKIPLKLYLKSLKPYCSSLFLRLYSIFFMAPETRWYSSAG